MQHFTCMHTCTLTDRKGLLARAQPAWDIHQTLGRHNALRASYCRLYSPPQQKLASRLSAHSKPHYSEQDIWVPPFGQDCFGAHPLSTGTFGRRGRLGATVSVLCRIVAVNV